MSQNMRKIRAGSRARSIAASAFVFFACLSMLLVSCHHHSVSAQRPTSAALQVRSNSFGPNGAIPRLYTCDGADISPELHWLNPPAGTVSLAIVMNDPDALSDFTHWIAYDIPSSIRELAEGASPRGSMPQGSAEGTNSFGGFGYGGPCPPPGKPHHYIFRLYALDIRLDLPPRATRHQLESAVGGHVLAEGQIIGVYGRSSQ